MNKQETVGIYIGDGLTVTLTSTRFESDTSEVIDLVGNKSIVSGYIETTYVLRSNSMLLDEFSITTGLREVSSAEPLSIVSRFANLLGSQLKRIGAGNSLSQVAIDIVCAIHDGVSEGDEKSAE